MNNLFEHLGKFAVGVGLLDVVVASDVGSFYEDVGNGRLSRHRFKFGLDIGSVVAFVELVDVGIDAELAEKRFCLGTERAKGFAEDDNVLCGDGVADRERGGAHVARHERRRSAADDGAKGVGRSYEKQQASTDHDILHEKMFLGERHFFLKSHEKVF